MTSVARLAIHRKIAGTATIHQSSEDEDEVVAVAEEPQQEAEEWPVVVAMVAMVAKTMGIGATKEMRTTPSRQS